MGRHYLLLLARELEEAGAKMKAKVLAPAATKTEFGMVANNVSEYDYDAIWAEIRKDI